ncbi:AAA family ATPase [Halalkalibacter alkaliphilus]|uniref:AAA family ATPase n=1 Tax=Halalkalibacter alkaliphilus TaxID=2917993 RepID=A0A9X2CTK2_9BACI|nr:AAA family ATPase [Halalkalibacter alkaliphilus]MCL7748008.1 AAA family ATPase [Halalkalibacter alkaliphilus]
MKKVSIVIADQDTSYIESLATYIRNSDYSSKFDLKLFSQKERLGQFLSSDTHANILLAPTSMLPQELKGLRVDVVIGLSEQAQTTEGDSVQTIFKYQPLKNLLSQVLTIYYERNSEEPKKVVHDGGTKVISVFSATGGTGKTTVAYNLARQIAQLDSHVFYLNIELVNSTPLLFETEEENNSSPLLYYLKANSEQLASKVEEMAVQDDETGISFFNLLPSAEEMRDLSEEELELLLTNLVDSGSYNYIVIDLDSTVNPKTLLALKKSDQVFWLLNNDIQSFHKTSYLLEELHSFLQDGSFNERVSLVLNRYTGQIPELLDEFNLKITSYLPYVPQWKEVTNGKQLSSIPVFNEYVLKLYRTHFETEEGAHNG